jgi:hypothetical protein
MLMPSRVLGFALLTALVAVATGVARTAASQLAPPYAANYEDELFTAIAQAYGMPDLKQTTLPPSYQEIRIRDHLRMVGDIPTPMLRLVAHDGQSQGELLLIRRVSLKPGNPSRADERCVPLRDEHVCVRTWAKSLDWRSVASMLHEVGAWEITERCDHEKRSNSLISYSDSGELFVQRL